MSGLVLPDRTHPSQAPRNIAGSRDLSLGCGVGDGQLSALPQAGSRLGPAAGCFSPHSVPPAPSPKGPEQLGTSPDSLAGVPGDQPVPRQCRGPGFLLPCVQPRLSSSILAGGNQTQVGAEGCVSQPGSSAQSSHALSNGATAVSGGSRGWSCEGRCSRGTHGGGFEGSLIAGRGGNQARAAPWPDVVRCGWVVVAFDAGLLLRAHPSSCESPPDESGKPIGSSTALPGAGGWSPVPPCTASHGGGLPTDLRGAAFMPRACTPCSKAWHLTPGEVTGTPGSRRDLPGMPPWRSKGAVAAPSKTSAEEAQGRKKLFKLLYDVDIRTTRYKLPMNKAGLGSAGFFTAGGGGLRNYPLAEGRSVLSSAPGHCQCLQP
ncbi:uncharacterized protein LOC142066904 [Phalacrocorax aristotelis]|uniref:uncharacterized protein LOC142066904 n=1 Tax=Phalacrocorax aristotelis TaxID=126867 RepID=UPI003F4B6820